MALAPEQAGIGIRRHFTTEGVHPYDEVEWERRDARITNYRDGVGRLRAARRRVPRPPGRSTPPTSSPRSTSAARSAPPSASRRCARSSTGWSTPSPAGASRAATSSTTTRPRPSTPSSSTCSSPRRRRSTPRSGSTSASRACPSRRRPASSSPSTTDGLDPQLVRRGGRDLQGRLGRGRQPVPHPQLGRAAQGRRHRLGPGQLHAGRRRLGRHHQVGRQDPPRRQDGHPRRRPPRRRGVHLVQGARGAQGPGAARRRLRHGPRRPRQPLDPVPERQQLGAGHRRVHAGRRRRRRLAPARPSPPARSSRTVRARELFRQIAPGGVGVRRSRHAVRHHHQPVAHRRQHRAHQRVEPVQRVHAPRQLGVQPGQPQPAEVPRRRRRPSTSTASSRAVEVVFTAQEILVGRADYPTEAHRRDDPPLPPARHRLRQPRRPAHGPRPALRQRRRPGLGRGHHRPDDRPRLRDVGPHRRPHGAVRRLRREPRAHAAGARAMHREAAAADRRGAGAGRAAVGRPGELGHGLRARRALRRAQQPGVGAGPHRHHRPDDGLRHHRHRARPRPREDEEAGRRRHDVDRQPDRAPGAATGSATTPARSTTSSPTSTSTSRSSAPRTSTAEHLPVFACSMGDNVIHYIGPRADDGGGAAVHLAVPSPRR